MNKVRLSLEFPIPIRGYRHQTTKFMLYKQIDLLVPASLTKSHYTVAAV